MFSAVIPALNAESTLARTLAALKTPHVSEIVVADGGSEDSTPDIAREHGVRLVQAPRGRGHQLRAGAMAAQGSWLLFLHADTVPEAGWDEEAAAFARRPDAREKAAVFRFALDDESAAARRLERAVALRCAMFGLAYGDQGLVISREFYDALGGFDPVPLFEDVAMMRRIGRRRLVLLETRAVTSAEAWRRDGYARRSARNLGLLARYLTGATPDALARRYRKGA